jgi:GDPmannose 4,6-dehydratase
VSEFCERAFAKADLDYRDYVKVDEQFYRPAEVDLLIGEAGKARKELGWKPQHTFAQLVDEMVDSDLKQAAGSASSTAPFAGEHAGVS